MVAITKPVVNGSNGTWGTILNQALDDIVAAVNNGDTTTGTLAGRVTTAENNIATLQNNTGHYSGTAAQRAASTNYTTGASFYETDTKQRWVGAGTTWVPAPGSLLLKVSYSGTAINIADGAVVALPWDTETYDRLAAFTPGASATTYTPGIAGWYEFTGGCSFSANATGTRSLRWAIGGSVQATGGVTAAAASSAITVNARPWIVQLSTTDAVSLTATSTGAAVTTAFPNSAYQPSMQVKYLGPA